MVIEDTIKTREAAVAMNAVEETVMATLQQSSIRINSLPSAFILLTQSIKHHIWNCYKLMQNPFELIGFCILKMFV